MAGIARRIWGLAVSRNDPVGAYKENIDCSWRTKWPKVINWNYCADCAQASKRKMHTRFVCVVSECALHALPDCSDVLSLENKKLVFQGIR